MAIAFVQTVSGTGALVLNSVVAGNLLICCQSLWRSVQTQAVVATPTDSPSGTFVGGIAGVPATYGGSTWDIGVGIFFEVNAASGTHTVTPEAASSDNGSLTEFSGMATANVLDKSATAKTADSDITSQVTGTTATTTQNDELVIIAHALGAQTGVNPLTYTDPPATFTKILKVANTASDIATFHAYKIISATGQQNSTFNWVEHEAEMSSHAAIATFKGAAVSDPDQHNPFTKILIKAA